MESKENRTIIKHFRVSEHENELMEQEKKSRDFNTSELVREKLGFDK